MKCHSCLKFWNFDYSNIVEANFDLLTFLDYFFQVFLSTERMAYYFESRWHLWLNVIPNISSVFFLNYKCHPKIKHLLCNFSKHRAYSIKMMLFQPYQNLIIKKLCFDYVNILFFFTWTLISQHNDILRSIMNKYNVCFGADLVLKSAPNFRFSGY